MCKHTPKLTDREVLDQARTELLEHLPLEADGYLCTPAALWNVLLGVAAQAGTLEQVCQDLPGAPTAVAVRGYVHAQWRAEDLPWLERQFNRLLAAQLPDRARRGARDLACDFHDQAYYGKTEQTRGLWIRAEAKDGTTRFYRVATAYVNAHPWRMTVAICFVHPDDSPVNVLNALVARIRHLKFKVKTLTLDRGFASVAVIRCLKRWRIPTLIACPIRGKQGGTRALCQGRASYRTQHTFRSPEYGPETATVAVCRVFTTARRTGRAARRAEWMLFIVVWLSWSPKRIRRHYRRRFGIETSYRCARQVRGWTTSSNPAYRFLLLALSFLLVNLWLRLRWFVAQIPRQRQRAVRAAHWRLARFAKFLSRALEEHFGCLHEIKALTPRPVT